MGLECEVDTDMEIMGVTHAGWKVRVCIVLSCEIVVQHEVSMILATSFELSLPLFDCLYIYKPHVLT